MKTNILHIVAHLGGGAGKILSSVSIDDCKNQHSILTMEETQNPHFEKILLENEVLLSCIDENKWRSMINKADIIQVDWWHHPLVSQFIVEELSKYPNRLIIWSHISGCIYPYIPANLPLLPDHFMFSSPYSVDNPHWSLEEKNSILKNSSIVLSSANTPDYSLESRSHISFVVGYIGFLGYNKIHPNFTHFCEKAVGIPNIQFDIVGDISYGQALEFDMSSSSLLKNKYTFTGYCENVSEKLSGFDVFGYPLNPEHTGTAENALLEAMAAGIPPVVLEQNSEKYAIDDGKTGLVVKNAQDYGDAIRWLYLHPNKRKEIGLAAAKKVRDEYSLQATIMNLNKVYRDVLRKPKSRKDFIQVFGRSPYEWFRTCYRGKIGDICGIAFSESKGSVKQYARYSPCDKFLQDVIKMNESVAHYAC